MLTKSPRWHLHEFTRNAIEYINSRRPIALKLIIGLPLAILFLPFCLATRRKIAMIPSTAVGLVISEPELLQRELEAGLHKDQKKQQLIWLFDSKVPSPYLIELYDKRLSGEIKLGFQIDLIKLALSKSWPLLEKINLLKDLLIKP